ncbi:MAG: acyl-ACP thioesterase [Rhodothermaceae bacterium]|nr:acyl-ACP thioesterase [Rhodothermaceae bacterium]
MTDGPLVWTEPFRVRSYEVGPGGQATVQTLGNWFQEAAGNHAYAHDVDGGEAAGWAWVMLRLRLRIHRLPAWRETGRLETWASGYRGALASREVRFLDSRSDVMAEGTSRWAVIDLVRRRPTRLPPALAHFPVPERPAPLTDEPPAPKAPDSLEREVHFTVRHSDLDVNQHVNNVAYLDWALEAVPSAFREAHVLREVDLAFKAESVFGDTVVSAVGSDGPAFAHSLTRLADGTPLAFVRTHWTPC